ncbi:SDR family oxidoreductase [Pelagibius litoralis]|uniref:SDR family oxidoreductase n=1 Tax=Pelagibius litoralis TaxID=374515 RepID=A0A967EYR1_9PROT|nr:SDR family oxidoreductase [Pelagibius litoralis]NIA69800.1 SDR family oxidoreductase [Pelagibius litoralis]
MTALEGTVAITGAAGGIGRALSRLLAENGCRLHLIDREDSDVLAFAEELGASASVHPADDAAAARLALKPADGPIHGFVHLAGTMEDDPDLGDDPAVWDRTIANNLRNAYDFATAMDERLPGDAMGRIVFTSSLAFRRGAIDSVAYSAAKAGLVGITRSLARRFRQRATVNALAPGIILTRMPEKVIERRRDFLLQEIPLGRFGAPMEVATVIRFLLSEDASYITGQCINVDGGQVMT